MLHSQIEAFREGAQKLGENLVEQVLESLIANQDRGIGQLQDLQKWSAMRTLLKLLTTKAFPRSNPHVEFGLTAPTNAAVKYFNKGQPFPIGRLQLRCEEAAAFLLTHWKYLSNSRSAITPASYRWHYVVKLDGNKWISPVVQFQNAKPTRVVWPDTPENTCELPVTDITSDVIIEFYHRQVVEECERPEKVMSDLFFGKDAKLFKSLESEPTSSNGPLQQGSLQSGSLDGVEAFVDDEWTIYGRVIVPIVCVMNYEKRRKQQRQVKAFDPPMNPYSTRKDESQHNLKRRIHGSSLFGSPQDPSSPVQVKRAICKRVSSHEQTEDSYKQLNTLNGWYHVYPISQQRDENKYVRPMAGYPGVGMLNPKISLGFVKFSITLHFEHKGYTLALVNNLNRPRTYWTLPKSLDLQALESSGARVHWSTTQLPIWLHAVKPYTHIWKNIRTLAAWRHGTMTTLRRGSTPPTLSNDSKVAESPRTSSTTYQLRSSTDAHVLHHTNWSHVNCPLLYALVVWAAVWLVTSYLRIVWVPLGSVGLLILLSEPYWIHKYVRPAADHYRSVSWGKGRLPYIGDRKRRVDDKTIPNAMGVRSARAHALHMWMENNALSLRCPRDSTAEQFLNEGYNIATPTTVESDDAQNRNAGSDPVATAVMYPSLIYPRNPFYESSIGSSFGRLDISIYDPTNSERVYGVFSDDTPTVDVFKMRHLGIVVMEACQFLFAINACVMEKLQYAFNWSDPMLSKLSLLVVMMLGLQATVTIAVLRWLFNATMLRTLFVFLPLFINCILVDTQFIKDYKLHELIDSMLVSLSHSMVQSHVVGRLCVDAWDLMYSTDLISWKHRTDRINDLNERAFNHKNAMYNSRHTTSAGDGPTADSGSTSGDWLESLLKGTPRRREELGAKFNEAISNARRWWPGQQQTEQPPPTPPEDTKSESSTSDKPAGVLPERHSPRPTKADALIIKHTLANSRGAKSLQHLIKRFLWLTIGQWLDLEIKFIIYWFMRLPDQREIEHRQICASQWLTENIDDLIPPSAHESLHAYLEDMLFRVRNTNYPWTDPASAIPQ